MTATLASQAPRFHSLTGTQPVGQTQVATTSEYAGTITAVTRQNDWYWAVNVRSAVNAFVPAKREQGKTVTVWFDTNEGRYVVDYWGGEFNSESIEADRPHSLRAAIGVAVTVAAQRWFASREALYR
jgi:hypothetical protein